MRVLQFYWITGFQPFPTGHSDPKLSIRGQLPLIKSGGKMPEAWTCDHCGAKAINRKVESTSLGDRAKQFITVPAKCSDPQCPNSERLQHGLEWCSPA